MAPDEKSLISQGDSSCLYFANNFLFPSIRKSYKGLKKGGHLAIYVNDYIKDGKKYYYVRDMRKFISEMGMKYLGTFNWVNVESSMKIRDIYIWKKL